MEENKLFCLTTPTPPPKKKPPKKLRVGIAEFRKRKGWADIGSRNI